MMAISIIGRMRMVIWFLSMISLVDRRMMLEAIRILGGKHWSVWPFMMKRKGHEKISEGRMAEGPSISMSISGSSSSFFQAHGFVLQFPNFWIFSNFFSLLVYIDTLEECHYKPHLQKHIWDYPLLIIFYYYDSL